MSDGAVLRSELDQLGNTLGEANTKLYVLEEEFDQVKELFDDLFNDLLVSLLEEYEEAADPPKRLPGEDVRNAIVTKQIRNSEPALFGKYRRLRAELMRKEKATRRLEKRISSKQSQLKSLTVELQAVGA